MPLSDLLAASRQHRADVARNFDAILAAALAEFTERGTDAALDDIARHGASAQPGAIAASPRAVA
jgi:hypothetical protein